MRKFYPYLQNVYVPDLNVESAKRRFLSYIDDFVNQRQYVKMTLLDWHENPLKSIEGVISSGSISKDGKSAVRRTCSLTCAVNGEEYDVMNMKSDFALNKKIFIEIGIKNDSPYYQEYPILWFPQGVFFISSFSMNSSSSTSVTLSLGLKDKMAMLNGDIGGTLQSTVRFDAMDTQLATGEWVEQKVLIYNIINELVHHYGQEDLNNIIIEDVPLRIRSIMKWNANYPLYGKVEYNDINSTEQWTFSLTDDSFPATFEYGDDVGYIYSDFVVNEELYGAPGNSVCTILDKIKSILGNYEYFYDEMGIFHFREIKNFLNVTQAEFVLDAMAENDYIIETTNEKAIFAFDDDNITSITVTPQYENIKNDYVIHGLRQLEDSNSSSLVMYHLAIDSKPEIKGTTYIEGNLIEYYGVYNNVVLYTDPVDRLNKLAIVEEVTELPTVGNFNKYYLNNNKVYYWDNTMYKELQFQEDEDTWVSLGTDSKYFYRQYYAKDWRTFLYLKGLQAQNLGTDEGEYFAELAAFWPREYNLEHSVQDWYTVGTIKDGKYKNSAFAEGNYFLDFIDTTSELGKYSISAIGRRSDVVQDDKINCLFEPEIPNVIFLNIDYPSDNVSANTPLADDQTLDTMTDEQKLEYARKYCDNNGHPWTQVKQDIYSNLTIGGYLNSAYERLRYELFLYTNFQKTISLTSLPVFYLEPNSRVSVNEQSTNTYGDYAVQTINITFGPGANMSSTLNEVYERL